MDHKEPRARPLPQWVEVPAFRGPVSHRVSVRITDAPMAAPTARARPVPALAMSPAGAPDGPAEGAMAADALDLEASLEAELVAGLDRVLDPPADGEVSSAERLGPAADGDPPAPESFAETGIGPADGDYRALWASELRAALGDDAVFVLNWTGAADDGDEDSAQPPSDDAEQPAAGRATADGPSAGSRPEPAEADDFGPPPERWARQFPDASGAASPAVLGPTVDSRSAFRSAPRVRDLAVAGVLVIAAVGGGTALFGGSDRSTRLAEAGAMPVPQAGWTVAQAGPKAGQSRVDAAAPLPGPGAGVGEPVSALAQNRPTARRNLTEAQLSPELSAGAALLSPPDLDLTDVTLRGPSFADHAAGPAPRSPAESGGADAATREAGGRQQAALVPASESDIPGDETEPTGEGDSADGDLIEEATADLADPMVQAEEPAAADAGQAPAPRAPAAAARRPAARAAERANATTRPTRNQRTQIAAALAAGRPAGAHTTTAVNMRAQPDNKAPVVAVIPGGAQALVISCNLWCRVRVADKEGWIFQTFLADGMR